MMIRKWLQRADCVSVRCTTALGEKTVKISPTSSKRWSDAERTILTMEATRIEALAADGSVVAATDLSTGEEESSSSGVGDVKDPLIARDIAIAKIISNAHKEGADVARQALVEGNQALIQIVALLTERTAQLERAWTATLNRMAANALAQVDGAAQEENADHAIMNMIMAAAKSGAFAGAAAKKPTNGPPKPKENGA
jgi:hypothetical protein